MFEQIEGNEKIYKKVMNQIQNLILNGNLVVGEKLPPERQLAEELNVSRPVIKQAISALEAVGIVDSRHGDGNYIVSNTGDLFNTTAINFYLNKGNDIDILEFRYILEVKFAGMAALKATDEQLNEMEMILEKMKHVSSKQERLELNNEFHREIIKISGNLLIINIYDSILDLIIKHLSFTDGIRFYNSHLAIFEAIKNRDPQLAARNMAKHFTDKFPNYEYYDQLDKII